MLKLLEVTDPAFTPDPPAVYAVTCRCRKVGQASRLEAWAYSLSAGKAIPALPIWLSEDMNVMLDLEGSYEETCRVLRIA